MKKIITVAIAVVLTLPLQAVEKAGYYAGVKLGVEESNTGGSDSTKWAMTFGKHINNYIDAELYTRTKDKEKGGNDTRLEAAVIGKYKLTDDLSTYLRAGVGNKYTRNDDFGYWTVEPGVKYKLNNDWSVKAGVRFRDAFETDRKQNDHTYKLGVGYKVASDTTLDVGYDWKRGDSDANSFGVGLKFEF